MFGQQRLPYSNGCKKHIWYPSGLGPASSTRLGVTGAAPILLSSAVLSKPAKLSPNVMSVTTAGGKRSPLSGGTGDCFWVSGSTRYGRFLKGSLKEDSSAGRLWEAPVPEPGAPLTVGQRICKLSVPVHAGGAGEPPVARASLARPLQSGVLDPALPRSRLVVRRSSGAMATDSWSPFMVMILGINWGRVESRVEEVSGVCARRQLLDAQWQFSGISPSKVAGSALFPSPWNQMGSDQIIPPFPFVSLVYFRKAFKSFTRNAKCIFEEQPTEVWCR